MSHDYHQSDHSDTIIFDGCAECDARAADPMEALLRLDSVSFRAMCDRMHAVESGDREAYRSTNEARVGKCLYAIAVLEERHGSSWAFR